MDALSETLRVVRLIGAIFIHACEDSTLLRLLIRKTGTATSLDDFQL